ncbi:hypothetical protein [Oceaniradius stylonematis]|uniref:hypothetical protein n=1 Tax=Oceaniradius stylonematis TaxID=2184161 RepID=UPI00273FE24A|nr:hypothetical protein [Oceaniradius stylonematis]
MNEKAKAVLSRMVRDALDSRRVRAYVAGQNLGVPSSFVNAVKNNEFDVNDGRLDTLVESLGIDPRNVDAARRPPPSAVPRQVEKAKPASNVVSFDAYKAKKWRQMSLFQED